MKCIKSAITFILLTAGLWNSGFCQEEDPDTDEAYSRANIAFTNFCILGKSATHYARCIKSENYQDPGRTHRWVNLNQEEFRDDGEGNDLAAGDGILTSVNSYTYAKGQLVVPPGQYKAVNQAIIFDDGFQYKTAVSPDKIRISCKFAWIRCRNLPPAERIYCHLRSHPFNGYFVIKECEIQFEQ